MSVQDANKALVRRYAEEVWTHGNLDVLDEYVAEDYELAIPEENLVLRGPEALKRWVRVLRSAFPDHRMTVHELIAEGDTVAWRWEARGTHAGDALGVPATGRSVVMTGVAIYVIRDGRIVERRGEANLLDMFTQVGLVSMVQPAC